VESSCKFGVEPSGSIKCWETIEWPKSGLSNSTQLPRVSLVNWPKDINQSVVHNIGKSCYQAAEVILMDPHSVGPLRFRI
jgi:hypothetical protein